MALEFTLIHVMSFKQYREQKLSYILIHILSTWTRRATERNLTRILRKIAWAKAFKPLPGGNLICLSIPSYQRIAES